MKLKAVKFANAVKVEGSEEIYADARKYVIEVTREPYLRIRQNGKTTWTYTSFYNVVSFTPYEEKESDSDTEQRRGPGRPRRIDEAKQAHA
jgi:hypothetical protein